jgi:hypothetical protein
MAHCDGIKIHSEAAVTTAVTGEERLFNFFSRWKETGSSSSSSSSSYSS